LTGIRSTLLAALVAVAAAAALGAWLGGASARVVVAAVAAGLLAAALARVWLGRVLAERAAAVRRFAGAQREGRLEARLPGTWSGELRPIAESLNEMAATLEARLRSSDARSARLEAVIEAMEEAVLVVDGAERVLLANPRLRELVSPSGGEPAPEGRALLEVVRQTEVVDGLRAALRKGEAVIAQDVQRYRRARDFLVGELRKIPGVEAASPDGTMYAFLRIEGEADSLAFCKRLVREQGLGLAPGSAFGPEGEGFVRWCFAAGEERLAEGVLRLRRALGSA